MFDLEAQLEQWKARFTSLEVMRPGDVEELEQHVRDSVSALMSVGLTPEEAFLIATQRVGAPTAVGREYEKVNGSHICSQRLFWVAAGALGYAVCGRVIAAAASLGQIAVSLLGGEGASVGYTAVGISCIGWGLLVAWIYRLRHAEANNPTFINLSARWVGIGVAVAVTFATLLKLGGEIALPFVMPVRELSEAKLISNVATMISTVVVPLVLFVVLLRVGHDVQANRARES